MLKVDKYRYDRGVTSIEYGLIGALISVVILGSVALTGQDVKKVFCDVSSALQVSSNTTGCVKNMSLSSGVTVSELQNDLTDNLDLSYIPTSMGGTATYEYTTSNYDMASELADLLTELNNKDPIVNILGLTSVQNSDINENYDHINDPMITDYDSAVSYLSSLKSDTNAQTEGFGMLYNDVSRDGDFIEVTTQSGKVYSIESHDGSPLTPVELSSK